MAENNYGSYYYGGGIGNFNHGEGTSGAVERKYTVIQSLWTKPIKDKERLANMMFLCALSLAYAHKNGYKVHMHTDKKGVQLMKLFGYEELLPTLDDIPNTVPTELFAAGKFFAMRAEGTLGKVHIDNDVFLKKPGVLDKFYKNNQVDVICQMEEDMSITNHWNIIKHMHILGYPASTRPNWHGSMNTGVIGFNNPILAAKYMSNYFDALAMYTQEQFDAYKDATPNANLHFDFVLEQINLSHMSVGYNTYTLLPTKDPVYVADKIGFQHEWGCSKWDNISKVRSKLQKLDPTLYLRARSASIRAKR